MTAVEDTVQRSATDKVDSKFRYVYVNESTNKIFWTHTDKSLLVT